MSAAKWFPKSVEGISVADLAYTAGIIDGEGCISISPCDYSRRGQHLRKNYCMRIFVTTTDAVICPWLQQTFGGAIYAYEDKRYGKKAALGTVRRWSLSMKASAGFLNAILPYLKLKKERAELALQFCELLRGPGGNKPLPEENMVARRTCYDQMREFNAKRKALAA